MRIAGWNTEIGGPRWWARLLGFGALAGFLLGIFGPFGSYMNGSVIVLLLHWTFMTMFGTAIVGLTVPHMVRFAVRRGFPLWFALALSLIVIALPLAALSMVEARWLWPRQTARMRPADWYGQTLLSCLFVTAGWLLVERALSARTSTPDMVPAAPLPAGPVLCLQMEDHYVRVHRATGSTLELMPLHDAIAAYGAGGLQVHRSWWVAADAITGAARDGRNWHLTLANGLRVPVSRTRLPDVRARRLIGPDD